MIVHKMRNLRAMFERKKLDSKPFQFNLLLPLKPSMYTETRFGAPKIKLIPQIDRPARGSLAAEVYAFVSIDTVARTAGLSFDFVFVLGPDGHE